MAGLFNLRVKSAVTPEVASVSVRQGRTRCKNTAWEWKGAPSLASTSMTVFSIAYALVEGSMGGLL